MGTQAAVSVCILPVPGEFFNFAAQDLVKSVFEPCACTEHGKKKNKKHFGCSVLPEEYISETVSL